MPHDEALWQVGGRFLNSGAEFGLMLIAVTRPQPLLVTSRIPLVRIPQAQRPVVELVVVRRAA